MLHAYAVRTVLRITYYVLRITYYVLRITYYVLRITYYVLRITYYVLRITYYVLRITYYVLRITYYVLRITYYVLRITYYVLRITYYVLRITYYVLRINTWQFLGPCVLKGSMGKTGERGRVCYSARTSERGRLVGCWQSGPRSNSCTHDTRFRMQYICKQAHPPEARGSPASCYRLVVFVEIKPEKRGEEGVCGLGKEDAQRRTMGQKQAN